MTASTTIVVPCFNEAQRLQPAEFQRFGRQVGSVRFLFVDDGSTDGTRSILEGLCAAAPDRFELLSLPDNRGQGEAVRFGIQRALARGDAYVGYWDADLATPLSEIPRFLSVLERHAERLLVLGMRRVRRDNGVKRHPLRRALGRLFGMVASRMLGLRIYDTQCGAKLFRRSAEIETLFAAPFLSRWIFDVELLARLIHIRGGRRWAAQQALAELPLRSWHDVAGSKVRAADFLQAIPELMRIGYELHCFKAKDAGSADRSRIASGSFSS
jgi:glycosyltransferase involved in cell wall biosynthesis